MWRWRVAAGLHLPDSRHEGLYVGHRAIAPAAQRDRHHARHAVQHLLFCLVLLLHT